MLGWILSFILLCITIYVIYQNKQKQVLDLSERNQLESERNRLDKEVALLRQKRNDLATNIDKLNKQSDAALERYNNAIVDKTEELENYIEKQKSRKEELLEADIYQRGVELENSYNTQRKLYEHTLEDIKTQCEQQAEQAQNALQEVVKDCETQCQQYRDAVAVEQSKFESLRQPLLQYEMEKQQRLFYTIQLPEEYQPDIDFLLNTVSLKVQHPDIISKLVWAEYVKPYLDDTFKRVSIKSESGIYKLTNIENNKSYVGKSTDIKKRIADHFKSSIGIKSIADQAVHHEILKTGFWNWSIEAITYCDKDQLSDLEKYYIDFFKTQEWGYNKTGGG